VNNNGNPIENARPKNPPPPPPKAGGLAPSSILARARGEIPRTARVGGASVAPPLDIINSEGPTGVEASAIIQARMLHRQVNPAMRAPGIDGLLGGTIGPIDGLRGGPDLSDPNHPAPAHRDAPAPVHRINPAAIQGEEPLMNDLQRCLDGMYVAGGRPDHQWQGVPGGNDIDRTILTNAQGLDRASSVGGVHRHIPGAASSDSISDQETRQERRRSRQRVRDEEHRARRRNDIEVRLDASIAEVLGAMDTSSDEGEVIRTRAGGPGNPWVQAQPKASNPGRGRRGMEDQ
jgi:hypothetical protein